MIDRRFSLAAHLNAREGKAVRKTVSGVMKIPFPHGQVTPEELVEVLSLALEGRRRLKEQLKKTASFEYYHTSLSYILQDSGEEKFAAVPEQGGRDLISTNPLAPGAPYSAGVGARRSNLLWRPKDGRIESTWPDLQPARVKSRAKCGDLARVESTSFNFRQF